jgi:hypothetical protein
MQPPLILPSSSCRRESLTKAAVRGQTEGMHENPYKAPESRVLEKPGLAGEDEGNLASLADEEVGMSAATGVLLFLIVAGMIVSALGMQAGFF